MYGMSTSLTPLQPRPASCPQTQPPACPAAAQHLPLQGPQHSPIIARCCRASVMCQAAGKCHPAWQGPAGKCHLTCATSKCHLASASWLVRRPPPEPNKRRRLSSVTQQLWIRPGKRRLARASAARIGQSQPNRKRRPSSVRRPSASVSERARQLANPT
eukprot:GHRQ01035772.1.p1 GENE.GHRQ01035772.1~~GHRQ01035772.1.p1  ORF type:complete len:159 (+),score=14.37 GHRQ01035772.1:595-1071(+)